MQVLRPPSAIVAILWLTYLLCQCTSAGASTINVKVTDRDARPLAGVTVFWRPPSERPRVAASGATAVMDQVDTRFVPHVLIVQAGTSVQFPNNDSVAHHVYSFSHPNQFKLPIYKGDAHPPVEFLESGVVVLGCNIHDNMLGYIVVVETSAYGTTNELGEVQLETDFPGGEVVVWSPRIRDALETLVRAVDQGSEEIADIRINLLKGLRPEFDENSEALSWSDY